MTGNRPDPDTLPPLLRNKVYDAPSEFAPENLLREARRQKNLPHCAMPEIGILDPDGDIVRYLAATDQADRDPCWACYHTDLYRFEHAGLTFGIVGCAVGAPFAVLVAEEMFASGCRLLISVTSCPVWASHRRSTSKFTRLRMCPRCGADCTVGPQT